MIFLYLLVAALVVFFFWSIIRADKEDVVDDEDYRDTLTEEDFAELKKELDEVMKDDK